MTRIVSLAVLVGIIVVIGILFFRVMAIFLLPLFLAALLVVIFHPVHRWFQFRFPGRSRLAAALTTATVMLLVLLPSTLIITFAAVEASSLLSNFSDRAIKERLSRLRGSLGLEIPYAEELRYFESSFSSLVSHASGGATADVDVTALPRLSASLEEFRERFAEGQHADLLPEIEQIEAAVERARETLPGTLDYQARIAEAAREFHLFKVDLLGGEYQTQIKELANPTDEELRAFANRAVAGAPSWLRTVGGATGALLLQLIFGLVVMVICLYFFLVDGPAMLSTLMRLSPLDDQYEQELLAEFSRVSRAVVMASLLSAVAQGLLAGVAFSVIGLWDEEFHGVVFLLTMLTIVFALIPFVGAASVWVPACIWLFLNDHPIAAAILAVYGAGVVSMADNVIKPIVLHGQSNLHPLLALLSVLGGVQALGPIGVLVGPMVVVFLQTLLNILHRELTSMERRARPEGQAS